jgi:hypothetical protein
MVKRSLKTRTRKQLSKKQLKKTRARKHLSKTTKRGKKGGFYDLRKKISGLYNGTPVKTHCCEKSTVSRNIGFECKPSTSGQCFPHQYRYKCLNNDFEKTIFKLDENGEKIPVLDESSQIKKDKLNFDKIDLNTDDYNEKGAQCKHIPPTFIKGEDIPVNL